MLAPVLPCFLGMTSATTGKVSKIFPKYQPLPKYSQYPINMFPSSDGTVLTVYSLGYREILNVERENNQTPIKLAVSSVSSGSICMKGGWDVEQDHKRLDLLGKLVLPVRTDVDSLSVPGQTGPFAIALVNNYRSFHLLHALFALADPGMTTISCLFATTFSNLLQYIEDEWLVIVDSIEKGIIPELENIEHVRVALEVGLS